MITNFSSKFNLKWFEVAIALVGMGMLLTNLIGIIDWDTLVVSVKDDYPIHIGSWIKNTIMFLFNSCIFSRIFNSYTK